MKAKKGGKGKLRKAVGIALCAIIAFLAIFTVVSHAVFRRSDMATAVEIYFRLSGTKHKFADPDACAAFIAQRGEAPEYSLNASTLKSGVEETAVNNCRVYTLTASDAPDFHVLYLHGGAYVNDASVYQWRFCDRLARELNAEVIVPIYPLAPNHTWRETFELLQALYTDQLPDDGLPLIIMGDSAGGGLAVAFCETLNELGLEQPDQLILFSPWLDCSMSNPDIANYEAVDPMLSAYGLVEMGKCWADDLELNDYKVSPIFGDVSCLRNVHLFVGTREIFYPDVCQFHSMLESANIASTLTVGQGMNHVYPLYPIPEADEAFAQVCNLLVQ
ncbi:MAG: alpha/beta hydrolase [Clostridia bacterium]|nr:alpha/beta hydrolase [Clostridia bacterium]